MPGTHFRAVFLLLAAACGSLSAQTVFVVRHADRYGTEPDPSITELGQRQAKALASLLAGANIRNIYTTEFIRTRQTAAPIAALSGVEPVVVPQADLDSLIRKVL